MSHLFLRHIENCTRHDPSHFVPLAIGKRAPGKVRQDFVSHIAALPGFTFEDGVLRLAPQNDTPENRTEALARAAETLAAHHGEPLTREIYPVIDEWGEAPLAQIDRAAIPWMGTRGFGVHMNGYVRKGEKLFIWIARRDRSRRIDPGKLDNMVGGGLPIGYTPLENLCKESWEEAGLPPELARQAKPAGRLTYRRDMMKGVRNDVLFLFDLEMPEEVTPRNTDGEVESFTLLPAAEVAQIVAETDDFKFNCNLVLIDFLLRHNQLADAEVAQAMTRVKQDKPC